MDHGQRLDGFPVAVGIVSIVIGLLMLGHGERTGWSLLAIAVGFVLVGTHWLVARRIDHVPLTRVQAVVAAVGLACVWVAIIYLSRGADDLPRIFPGHSARSEHYRFLQGVSVFVVGVALLVRAVSRTRRARSR